MNDNKTVPIVAITALKILVTTGFSFLYKKILAMRIVAPRRLKTKPIVVPEPNPIVPVIVIMIMPSVVTVTDFSQKTR